MWRDLGGNCFTGVDPKHETMMEETTIGITSCEEKREEDIISSSPSTSPGISIEQIQLEEPDNMSSKSAVPPLPAESCVNKKRDPILEASIVEAVKSNNVDRIVELMADRDDQKFYGKLVAEIAAEYGHVEMFELLHIMGIINVGNALEKAGRFDCHHHLYI
jgi:hypothetical protein